ncbi:hypothetical protein CK510_11515 [Brunnivagina elsteri CCALA 953]|uniref:Uncharacterized protein n=1 Tax=Brunnivagina elsteri CCALA 953 TaxID=987040 RepID=A0A2A2TJG7_9CYAN|nr:hypothetical protein CK510_11515 [Calothrix elsteri CCALA 953]
MGFFYLGDNYVYIVAPSQEKTYHSRIPMNKPKFNSLAFYVIAISSVLVIFKTVTVYGESKLKAPQSIDGDYELQLTEKLPDCQNPNILVLNIQQSGIFLNSSLSPKLSTVVNSKLSPTSENNLSLNGKLNKQQFSLSGKAYPTIFCHLPVSKTSITPTQNKSHLNPSTIFTIKANLNPQGGFSGQISGLINSNNEPKPIKFNAIPIKIEKESQNPNDHSKKNLNVFTSRG